ncbi:cell adhesion molecule Dscam1-like [Tachypleus tridentatus]|uniref:cell adhesion molecule Dscam1-like n=1 Tax=Tachypleus tridentatus TaxID=6853 RepID=UPI003FD54D6B
MISIISLTAPLKASVEPHSLVMLTGGIATLTCVVSGHPVDSIVWMKNFRSVIFDGRIHFRSRNVLHIRAVTRADQGMYQCFVYSHGNNVQAAAQLIVGDVPPELHNGFAETTLDAGASLSLQCIVSGHPLPEVTWLIDKLPLPEGRHFHTGKIENENGKLIAFLNISRIHTRDGGFYECVASNGIGLVSHVAKVNVYGPPYVRPMKNVTVVEGERLILQCPVAGYPIKHIVWERGSLQLPINHRQQVFQNGSLIIREVKRDSDQGQYRCNAISEDGASDHQDVTVKVTIISPEIKPRRLRSTKSQFAVTLIKQIISTRGPAYDAALYFFYHLRPTPTSVLPPTCTTEDNPFDFPNRVREGSAVVITCGVNEGDPPFDIKLLKMTILCHLNPELLYKFTSVSFCLLCPVTPHWIVEPTNTSVILGQSIVIDCAAEGSLPHVTWKKASADAPKDFVPLYNSQHYAIFDNGSLSVRDVVKQNEGFYLCQISNNVGPDLTKLISVTVYAPPTVHVQHQVHTVVLDETLEIRCEG